MPIASAALILVGNSLMWHKVWFLDKVAYDFFEITYYLAIIPVT